MASICQNQRQYILRLFLYRLVFRPGYWNAFKRWAAASKPANQFAYINDLV
jgi:hypothetical protein